MSKSGEPAGFVPKGFRRLREVIEDIGKATVQGWTGREQDRANTEPSLGTAAFGKEFMYRVWLRAVDELIGRHGREFERAAKRHWADSQTHPDDADDLQRISPIYEEQISKLWGLAATPTTMAMLHAARRVCEEVNDQPQRRIFHCPRPYIEGETTCTEIALARSELAPLKFETRALILEREAARQQNRDRLRTVWQPLRGALHSADYRCVVWDEVKGREVTVPVDIWAGPQAEEYLRSCAYNGREILVAERSVRPRAKFSPAEAERGYKERVEGWPQGVKPPTRDEDVRWLKAEFGATQEFAREMRTKHAPDDWTARGRRKTGGN